MSISREIECQIQDLVDGHLDEDQQRVLIERIANDPELTRLYVSHVGLDLTLSKSMRFSPAKLADLRQTPPSQPQIVKALLASAAVVALSLVVLRLIIVPDPPPLATFRASPGTVYQLQRAGDKAPEPGSLILNEGDEMTLTQGVVELGFGAGVRGIVEGPAKVVFEKKDRVRMTDGRAFFEVPAAEKGFKVITGDLIVTDLGTEFAIKVGDGSPDEVHVIKGRVEVAPRGHAGSGKVLEAGHALSSLGSDLTVTTPFKGSIFLKHLPDRLPYLHIPGDMSDDGSIVVIGDIQGEEPIKARFLPGKSGSDALPTVEGRFGSAFKLTGQGDHVLTDWAGIGQDDPRTVAFWVRMNPGEATYDTACVVWGHRPQGIETVNRKWNVQVALDRETKSRCIVNTTFGGFWFEGTTSLDDGQWHHVAAVYTGQNLPSGMPDLRLFIDGKREAGEWVWNEPIDRKEGNVRVRTETRVEEGAEPLMIGKPLHDRNSFRGELDEIYVIAGALETEAVQTLWQSNRLDLAKPRKD